MTKGTPYRGNGPTVGMQAGKMFARRLEMAKPRKRPTAVKSAYFEGVTPLWVAPGRDPIPHHYHAASISLADWAGPD